MNGTCRALAAASLIVVAVAPVRGQTLERPLSQLQMRVWTEESGLPVNAVTRVVQTADGYVWIGTESGLARFDGAQFVTMNSPSSPLYTSASVESLERGEGNTLWIGTSGGLIRGRGNDFTRWAGDVPEISNGPIDALRLDAQSRLWVGTGSEGLFVLAADGRSVRRIRASGFEPRSVRDIALSRRGGPWVATELGLARVRSDSLFPHLLEERTRDLRAVLEDGRGVLWVGTREGLFRLEGRDLVPAMDSGPLRSDIIRSIHEDREGRIWVATAGHGIYRLSSGRWESLSAEQGLPGSDIRWLSSDSRGDLWIAATGGVALLYRGAVVPITETQGLSSPVTLPVLEDRRGNLWVGTFGGGVTRVSGTQARVWGVSDGLPSDVVLSLAEDASGRIWIGTRAGLRIWDGAVVRLPPAGALRTATVAALLAARDGHIWVGTTDGLYATDGETVREYGPQQGLTVTRVFSLYETASGSILAGTKGGGGYRLIGGRFESLGGKPEAEGGTVYGFHEDRKGCIWLSAAEGLVRLCNGTHVLLDRRHGLPDPQTFAISSDGRGFFWISSNHGVFRIPEAELNAAADRRLPAISARLFTRRDGMPSTEANGGFYPAAWKSRAGTLYFPTMAGIAVFDPKAIEAAEKQLKVRIEGILSSGDDPAWPALLTANLPAGTKEFAVRYTAIDFRHGDLAEFQYRLIGFDTAWVSAGTRRTAYYTSLSPGRYRFVARARLPGQEWSSAAALPLHLHPSFWETIWFRVLVGLLLAGIALALHRWRVRGFRRRQADLLALVRAREDAERRYREIFENASEVVLIVNTEGRIEAANDRAAAVLKSPVEALVGSDFFSLRLVAPEQTVSGADMLASLAASDQLSEIPLRACDRSHVRLEVSTRELRQDGRLEGYQLIARDVTEKRRLEEQLRQAQRMEAVGQLAGGISHDFNNLLTAIQGHTELLLADLGPSHPLREDAQEVARAADRAAVLTRQLLAFSRKQPVETRVLDLNEVVSGMEKLLRRLIGEHIDVIVDLTPDLPSVRADAGQLEQVIANLAVNARDAMPRGGEIRISTRTREQALAQFRSDAELPLSPCVEVAVTDTGAGIAPEIKDRIFEPFFTTKPVGKGTGLGLSTVYAIVEQSGGHITVESEPGHGTTFRILLPVSSGSVKPQKADPPPAQSAGSTTGLVLLVEDDEAVRRLAHKILERNGYSVAAASHPAEALKLLDGPPKLEVDLVITDVVMPGMTGPEFVERLAQIRPGVPTILMSGYSGDELAVKGASIAALALLQKPFGPADLMKAVQGALERQPAG